MNRGNRTISVLMATYAKERPERLARALDSIYRQTRPPDQMVLVVDGPVGPDQEEVIAVYQHDTRIPEMRVVRLPTNVGLARALNAGLKVCRGEWIMRMDSDDISLEDRTEVQMAYIERHSGLDVVSGWSEEFFDETPATRIKASPTTHEAIIQGLKWRNILVHPSMMMRASTVRSVGGYSADFPLLEDWNLWVRLALAKARFAVIPKVLVRMLVGKDQAARRGGLRYLAHEVRFRTFCWRNGFINLRQYALSTAAYGAFRLAGPALRGRLYKIVRTQEVREHV
jgi:glycosyltransferase involved in cell wall biosynthesis